MKSIFALPAVAAALTLTGCEVPTPSLLSLEPVVKEQEAPPDILLAGVWESADSGQVCLIHKAKDKENVLEIAYLSGDSRLAFTGRLFRAGDARILELKPEGDDEFHVAGYSFARVWIEGNQFRWAFLDSEWLKQQMAAIPSHTAENKSLLLAPGPVIRAFLEKFGADERACSTNVTWQRMQ